MDAAIYARLSRKRKTPDNPAGLSENVRIQTAETKNYADEKTWLIVGTFQDDDRSASKFSKKPRPDYNRMLEAIRRDEVEVILVTEMPRLYRRIEELLEVIKLAETTRLQRIETTDGMVFDLSTPEGVYQAIGAVNSAVLESSRLSGRLKRKKTAQARQGKSNGGGRPYGYDKTGMELVPSEVALLIEAKDRYIAGETMRDIVRDFYRRVVVSPYGKPWTIENFQRVLFSKRYLGIRVHHQAEYPAQWPAIFTQAEYDLMNARRLSRAARYPGKSKGTGRQYLLTGLLFCGRCGTPMIGSRRKTRDGYQRRYRCRAVDNHGLPLGCGRVFRGAEPLDAWITEAVLYRFDTPEAARLLAEDEPDHTEALITAYQTAKLTLYQMVRDYATGFLDRDEFGVAKLVAEDNLQTARDNLARYQSRQARILLPARESIREAWEHAGLDWRRDVIKLLVDRIVVHPGLPGSMMWRGWRFDPDSIEVSWRV